MSWAVVDAYGDRYEFDTWKEAADKLVEVVREWATANDADYELMTGESGQWLHNLFEEGELAKDFRENEPSSFSLSTEVRDSDGMPGVVVFRLDKTP